MWTWHGRIRHALNTLYVGDAYVLPDGSGILMRVDIAEFKVARLGETRHFLSSKARLAELRERLTHEPILCEQYQPVALRQLALPLFA